MRIVFLSPSAERGGAESVLVEMLKALREAKPAWALHLIAGEDGPLLKTTLGLGIPSEVLPFPLALRTLGENRLRQRKFDALRQVADLTAGALGLLGYRRLLRGRLKQLKPDIVHSNGMKMHFLSALALRRQSRPALVWHFHDYLGARPLMSRLLRRVASRSQQIIANSESVAEDARLALPFHASIQTVYNSVDSTLFTPDGPRLDLDQLAGLGEARPGTVRVGLIATFAFWKGHEIFLQSIAELRGKGACDHLRFYIIGAPLYATAGSQYQQSDLTGMAKALGIDDMVGFTGFVEDAPAAFRALDIVVHASTAPEPFGLVILQAMASARPVITTATGGAAELVRPKIDAIVLLPGDSAALARAIEQLSTDRDLRVRLGVAARAKVVSQFTTKRLADALVAFYEQMQAAPKA